MLKSLKPWPIMNREFKEETNKIIDPDLKVFIRNFIYWHTSFFKVPSTRSGKYHPADEYFIGGLWLHTKRVVRVLEHLIESNGGFTHCQRDLLIAAAIIHDINKAVNPNDEKSGPETVYNTIIGTYGANRDNWPDWGFPLVELVANHGGRFYKPVEIDGYKFVYYYPSDLQRTLHQADYIASRTDIIINLDKSIDEKNKVSKLRRKFTKWLLKQVGINFG